MDWLMEERIAKNAATFRRANGTHQRGCGPVGVDDMAAPFVCVASFPRDPLEALGRARVRFLSDPLRDLSLLANDVVGVLLVDDLFDLCCLVSGHHDE
jgi:hypothetical protein